MMKLESIDLGNYNSELIEPPIPINPLNRHETYVYKLITTNGVFALYVSNRLPKFPHTQEYLSEIIESNFPKIKTPTYIKSFNGDFYIEKIVDQQTYYLSVKKWIDGNPYTNKLSELKNSAQALASIHGVSADYRIDKDLSLKNKSGLNKSFSLGSDMLFIEYLDLFLSKHRKSNRVCSWIEKNKKTLIKEWQECISFYNADIYSKLPRGILHGDFTPQNILFENDFVVGVLDFNSIKYDAYLREIVWSALTFSQSKSSSSTLSFERFATFIKEYVRMAENSDSYSDDYLDYCYEVSISRCLKVFKNLIKKDVTDSWYLSEYLEGNMRNIDFLLTERSRISCRKNYSR